MFVVIQCLILTRIPELGTGGRPLKLAEMLEKFCQSLLSGYVLYLYMMWVLFMLQSFPFQSSTYDQIWCHLVSFFLIFA